jgi:hypothetical protein
MSTKPTPLRVRLLRRIRKDSDTGCWLWTGAANSAGYGNIGLGGKNEGTVMVHRISYELFNGPILPGFCVCHRCDTPACINPDHLFLGTRATNNADARQKGRSVRGERSDRAKLTEAQVLEIRALWAAGHKAKEIAPQYGINHRTIILIVNRRTWKHVGGEPPRTSPRRFTDVEKEEMHRMFEAGVNRCDIAKHFKTNKSSIYTIFRRDISNK